MPIHIGEKAQDTAESIKLSLQGRVNFSKNQESHIRCLGNTTQACPLFEVLTQILACPGLPIDAHFRRGSRLYN